MARLNLPAPSALALAAALAAALTAGATATPAAAAVDGDCLWSALPDAARAEMLAGYRAKGLAVLGDVRISDETATAFKDRCGVTLAEGRQAGEILGTMILAKGADQVLFERNSLKKGSLDKVWQALSVTDRKTLKSVAIGMTRGDNSGLQEAARITVEVVGKLGLPADNARRDVFGYLLGRGLREARLEGL